MELPTATNKYTVVSKKGEGDDLKELPTAANTHQIVFKREVNVDLE